MDASPLKDSSRFDSGAFGPRRLDLDTEAAAPEADIVRPEMRAPVTAAVQDAAIKRAPDHAVTSAETADLLEALRRRRGQREPMPVDEADDRSHSPVALFDALEPGYDEAPADGDKDEEPLEDTVISEASRRKGRTSMPSWDEIVFGARTEDGS